MNVMARRAAPRRSLRSFFLLALAGALLAAPAYPQTALAFPDGALSGDVTTDRAIIWTRTNAPATVQVEYGTSQALGGTSAPVQATASSDFTVKIELVNLQPATRYFYRVVGQAGERRAAGLIGSFRTAPAAGDAAAVTLLWGADISERWKPYRIFDAMRARTPDALLFLGDMVYADVDANARTLDEYRAIHRRNRDDEPFRRFARETSIHAIWDDHEVANNFDRTHGRLAMGRQALLESWPIRPDPADANRLYRSARWGRLVEVFILDTRQYRSPEFDRDDARKTMLGAAQKEWLKRALQTSEAPFKIVASTVPLKYHGVDSWEGYATERDELFDFIARHNIRRVVFVAGDVHYAAVLRYREGIVEGISGPLAQLINSRNRVAGEPETLFSYRAGFTFGLLRVTPSPPALTLEIWDVEGRRLYTTTIQP